MKLLETKGQKAFFFIVVAIAICVWIFVALWWMSTVPLEDDEIGWEGLLPAIPTGLFAYGVYCYLSDRESKINPVVGAILAFLVSCGLLSVLLFHFFDAHLINQFCAVLISFFGCVVAFVLFLDSHK